MKEAIRITLPSKNLGCLGFNVGNTYFDFHRVWCYGLRSVQMFISSYWIWKLGLSDSGKGWLTIKGWRPMR